MRFIVPAFLLVLCLSGNVYSQQLISLDEKDCSLQKIIDKIEKQTVYRFVCAVPLLRKAKKITIRVKDATWDEVKKILEKDQPLVFVSSSSGKAITLRERKISTSDPSVILSPFISIKGRIVGAGGEPIASATVNVNRQFTVTDDAGSFELHSVDSMADISISSIGYENKKEAINGRRTILITLKVSRAPLDEVIVVPYGKTSRRLNTGSIAKIMGNDIEGSSGANPMASIAGRASGLLITQFNGLPGASIGMRIRGQTSVGALSGITSNNPLIVIDGVPFAPNNNNIQAVPSGSLFGVRGRSPFPIINLHDIQSIEVLKDADATAIYGSRGGNGVILITTKRGSIGRPRVFVDLYGGFSSVSNTTRMMTTQQYVEMRNEALKNDQKKADSSSAPDLVVWDTERYTDFRKLLIGNYGTVRDCQITITGGNFNTKYSLGFNNHYETTVYPGNIGDKRRSVHLNLNNHYLKGKVTDDLVLSFSNGASKLISTDLTPGVSLPPNAPALYNSVHELNWGQDSVYYDNPMSYLRQRYNSTLGSILFSYSVKFSLAKNVNLKTILGRNSIWLDETSIKPIRSLNPHKSPKGSAYFGKNTYKSWIFEPYLEYLTRISKGKLTSLIGGSWQQIINNNVNITADGYTSDARLLDTTDAENVKVVKNINDYRYHGLFTRLNYNWKDRYLINLSGRREGSTRFGPTGKYGYFGAVGAAWVFTEEPFVKDKFPVLSFGKLHGSYGVTGNDQIGDNKFFDNWGVATTSYQGATPIFPATISDPVYSWEIIRKTEGAIELGFLEDRLWLTACYFSNRTSNQLISYKLPAVTGFNYVAVTNWPAIVRNSGVELSLRIRNNSDSSTGVHWTCEANLTIPRNKLLSFPRLANSEYDLKLFEGQSLTVQRGYEFEGVDPLTGYFRFKDRNNDGVIDYSRDYITLGNLDTKAYGGLLNVVGYKNWQLQVFMEARQQTGNSFLYAVYNDVLPGARMKNQPEAVLNRWQATNDHAIFQRYSTGGDKKAEEAREKVIQSSGRIADASFIRLKTLALSFSLPLKWLRRLHINSGSVYVQGYNLLTISAYKDLDPETQSLNVLPPLRTVIAGVKVNF